MNVKEFPGLVVMGKGSISKGRGFESLHRILHGHFSHIFVVKIVSFFKKSENKLLKRPGLAHFFKKITTFCSNIWSNWLPFSFLVFYKRCLPPSVSLKVSKFSALQWTLKRSSIVNYYSSIVVTRQLLWVRFKSCKS